MSPFWSFYDDLFYKNLICPQGISWVWWETIKFYVVLSTKAQDRHINMRSKIVTNQDFCSSGPNFFAHGTMTDSKGIMEASWIEPPRLWSVESKALWSSFHPRIPEFFRFKDNIRRKNFSTSSSCYHYRCCWFRLIHYSLGIFYFAFKDSLHSFRILRHVCFVVTDNTFRLNIAKRLLQAINLRANSLWLSWSECLLRKIPSQSSPGRLFMNRGSFSFFLSRND
jgi:hypothetical protein